MPVIGPVEATLQQGQFALLHLARFQRYRVTITAISNAELGGVKFRVTTRGGRTRNEFIGMEASLRLVQTLLGSSIEATAPDGVGALDVTYEVRTGSDA